MSKPITLYRLNKERKSTVVDGVYSITVPDYAEPVGTFVERAWCATHDLPMVNGTCMGITSRRCVPEPLPRLVQELPE